MVICRLEMCLSDKKRRVSFYFFFQMDVWQFSCVNVSLGCCSRCVHKVVSSGCDSGVLSVDTCQRRCDAVMTDIERHSSGMTCFVMGTLYSKANAGS